MTPLNRKKIYPELKPHNEPKIENSIIGKMQKKNNAVLFLKKTSKCEYVI